jgi:hypothetical protein
MSSPQHQKQIETKKFARMVPALSMQRLIWDYMCILLWLTWAESMCFGEALLGIFAHGASFHLTGVLRHGIVDFTQVKRELCNDWHRPWSS